MTKELMENTHDGTPLIIRGGRDLKPLTEPIVFEEESLPGFLRTAMVLIALLMVAFLIWAAFVRLDEVASAPGQVVPSGQVKVVQHLEGGVVAEVLVSEGELVHAGQVIARLDPVPALSELDQNKARYGSLLLRNERLKAVLEHRRPDFAAVAKEYPDLISDQQRIWQGMLTSQKSALEVVNSQVDQKRREVQQLTEQLETAEKQLLITSDQVEIRRQGVEGGVVSRQTFLETKRAQVTAEGEVARLRQQIRVARDSLAEYGHRHSNLGDTQAQDALAELGTVSAEMEQVRNSLFKLQDRVNRLDIKAPLDGVIQDLKIRTPGEVLPVGGTVTRVVPINDVLEAEVRISPADIGHIEVNQPVKVKVASYEYVRYGALPGTVAKVSATTFSDEQNKPYYKGVVRLERAWMGPQRMQNPVLPGMSVEADIVTGNKSLIQYLLKPIFVSLKNSFHER